MRPSPINKLLTPATVLVAIIWLLLPIQCTSSLRKAHNNAAAFVSNCISARHKQHRISIRKTSTLLLYQIVDEPLDQQTMSTAAHKSTDSKDDDDDDGIFMTATVDDDDDENNATKNQQHLTDESVEDNKDWISATRTLGSLILHLKDETKDSNVDVFGKPLQQQRQQQQQKQKQLPQIDQFGILKDDNNNSNDGWQSSLARYLLKLKRDEEDNRERIFEENKGKKRNSSSMMDEKRRDGENSKMLQLDQVRGFLGSFSNVFLVFFLSFSLSLSLLWEVLIFF